MMMIFCASFDADDDGKKKSLEFFVVDLFLPPFFLLSFFFSLRVCLFRVLKTEKRGPFL